MKKNFVNKTTGFWWSLVGLILSVSVVLLVGYGIYNNVENIKNTVSDGIGSIIDRVDTSKDNTDNTVDDDTNTGDDGDTEIPEKPNVALPKTYTINIVENANAVIELKIDGEIVELGQTVDETDEINGSIQLADNFEITSFLINDVEKISLLQDDNSFLYVIDNVDGDILTFEVITSEIELEDILYKDFIGQYQIIGGSEDLGNEFSINSDKTATINGQTYSVEFACLDSWGGELEFGDKSGTNTVIVKLSETSKINITYVGVSDYSHCVSYCSDSGSTNYGANLI